MKVWGIEVAWSGEVKGQRGELGKTFGLDRCPLMGAEGH